MSTGTSLLLLFGAFAVIAVFKGRSFYNEWMLFRTWRTSYLAQGEGAVLVPTPVITSLTPRPSPALPAVAEFASLAAPTDMTVLPNAGRAYQNPPADLRVSVAEMHRLTSIGKYAIPLGWWVGTKASLVTANLIGDVNHILITGQSNCGKDNFVMSWLYSLACTYSPQKVQFAFLDGKGALDLNGWHIKAHTWAFGRHKEDMLPIMERLKVERERRQQILWDAQCAKWEEYTGSDLPLLVIYVSELVLLQSIVGKQELGDWLNEELTTARATGIRFIIGTQTATKLDTRWRGQITLHVAGYQAADDGDEPNTGLSSKVLRKLGTEMDGTTEVVVGIPPSELPSPPGVAGVFTLVQGRTVLTVRCPHIDDVQRKWWLNLLPNASRSARTITTIETVENPLLRALMNGDPLPFDDEVQPTLSLQERLSGMKQDEMRTDPQFIRACVEAYSHLKRVRPVVEEVFGGGYTGSRHQLVTAVLQQQGMDTSSGTEAEARVPAVAAA